MGGYPCQCLFVHSLEVALWRGRGAEEDVRIGGGMTHGETEADEMVGLVGKGGEDAVQKRRVS